MFVSQLPYAPNDINLLLLLLSCVETFNIYKFYVVCTVPTVHICILYGSQDKSRLLRYTALTGWYLQPRRSVFTARYDWIFKDS
jgi:hypothetical protein